MSHIDVSVTWRAPPRLRVHAVFVIVDTAVRYTCTTYQEKQTKKCYLKRLELGLRRFEDYVTPKHNLGKANFSRNFVRLIKIKLYWFLSTFDVIKT